MGAQGPGALQGPKEHVSDTKVLNILSFFSCLFILPLLNFCMHLGPEYFKGAPGGSGRPGSAGSKGVKGAVGILFMIKKIVDIMMDNNTESYSFLKGSINSSI